MGARLLYHTADSASGGVSPFDEAIQQLIEGQPVRIACPYLTLDYLRGLIERTTDWRLVTDLGAWLASVSASSRDDVVAWVLQQVGRVRHYRDLHAKVLVSANGALVGSANFTHRGVKSNHEVSVVLDSEDQVRELAVWFDSLWEQAWIPTAEAVREHTTALPAERLPAPPPLPSTAPPIRAQLVSEIAGPETGTITDQQIAEFFALAPSREWLDTYLDLANEMITFTGLGPDDRRLAVTLREQPYLPLTVNQRYVQSAAVKHTRKEGAPERHPVVGLILPAHFRKQAEIADGALPVSSFRPWAKGETAESVPLYVSFARPAPIRFERAIRDAWREAVLVECDHGRASSFRRFHQPALYRAITEPEYRRRLLDLAFADAK